MNSGFSSYDFWQGYFTLEPSVASEDALLGQLNAFQPDFAVREQTFQYEMSGAQREGSRRYVEFPFYCGERYSMVIEYEPCIGGCTTNLFLSDARCDHKSQMGWGDLARWHPYCLRLYELDCLTAYWSRWDQRWEIADLPFLLLCQFIGVTDSRERETLADRAEKSIQRLGLRGRRRLEVPLQIPDGNYHWENDKDLGWVFTSDEYCCYSLRNKAHDMSDEGSFPFHAFADMMAGVESQLRRE